MELNEKARHFVRFRYLFRQTLNDTIEKGKKLIRFGGRH